MGVSDLGIICQMSKLGYSKNMRSDFNFLFFASAFFMLVLFGFAYFSPREEGACHILKDIYHPAIEKGVIVEKYVDTKNHAIMTVIIDDNGKRYKVVFIPFDNWNDFNRLTVGDTLEKPLNSFKFLVKNGFEFQLQNDCDYSSQ